LNLILERSSKVYIERTEKWASIAVEKRIPFIVTALGNPDWVVKIAHQQDIKVYHDVTNLKFAEKAASAGVDGFICVNNRAGGHAGDLSPQSLYQELASLGKPMVCAGGVGSPAELQSMLDLGYAGVQMGTRFIATNECTAHDDYKQAIVNAQEDDIVLTEKLTGVPVAVISTPYIKSIGTKAGPIARWMLNGRKTKHWMRTIYTLQSIWKLKKANLAGSGYKDYWQAGKSADSVSDVQPVAQLLDGFRQQITGS